MAGVPRSGKKTSVISRSRSVNQTRLFGVWEVPKACLSAGVHVGFEPGGISARVRAEAGATRTARTRTAETTRRMTSELSVACGLMPPAMPELEGVEHSFHDLPTGVRVHLASAGPPDAPPVLAVHGWPQHWWSWRNVIRELAGEFRLLCPDLRGLGWSGPAADDDYRKQRLAEDQIALIDALGIDRVRLVGHDWGGWTALLAALTAPDRVLSLLALSIGHPWVPGSVAALNAWQLAYQFPLAAPLAGERLIRDGRYVQLMFAAGRRDARGWAPGEREAYLDVLREPPVAHAAS
jgi:hypothetical protein